MKHPTGYRWLHMSSVYNQTNEWNLLESKVVCRWRAGRWGTEWGKLRRRSGRPWTGTATRCPVRPTWRCTTWGTRWVFPTLRVRDRPMGPCPALDQVTGRPASARLRISRCSRRERKLRCWFLCPSATVNISFIRREIKKIIRPDLTWNERIKLKIWWNRCNWCYLE